MNDGLIVDYDVFKRVTRNVLLNANVFRHKNIRTSNGVCSVAPPEVSPTAKVSPNVKEAELAFSPQQVYLSSGLKQTSFRRGKLNKQDL